MDEPADRTFRYYVSDLGKLLRERAFEAKQLRDSASGADRDYEVGRLMAYNEVVSMMQQQAIAFGLSAGDISLDGIDPDNDLV